jgi:hypothetical protein
MCSCVFDPEHNSEIHATWEYIHTVLLLNDPFSLFISLPLVVQIMFFTSHTFTPSFSCQPTELYCKYFVKR